LQYGIFEEATVSLALYDLQGRQLKLIDTGLRKVGSYSVNFDLQGYASGQYLVSLSTSRGARMTRQLVIQ
jgi:PP-loop superfamily ATP-utilizing enzyme